MFTQLLKNRYLGVKQLYDLYIIIYYYYYYLLQVIYKAKQPVTPDQQVKKVQVD